MKAIPQGQAQAVAHSSDNSPEWQIQPVDEIA